MLNADDRITYLRAIWSEFQQKAGTHREMSMNDLPERVRSKIEPEPMSGCWLWPSNHSYGYGYFGVNRVKRVRAHRLVYQLLVGEIPKDKVLDHLCRVRCCVNPAHLRVVTQKENTLAVGSMAVSKRLGERTHCPRGHLFDPSKRTATGARRCLACHRELNAARRLTNPEPYRKAAREWRARRAAAR